MSTAGAGESNLAAVFGRAASTFGGMGNFIHFGARLVAHAALRPGEYILDAATGRGAVAFHAAAAVGPTGRIVGIDIADGMLNETAKVLASGRWPMDAQQLDFPDASFDAVLCGFALWFFPQPAQALREFRRVLKPGGRLALSTIAHDSPYHALLQDTLRPHIASNAPSPSAEPSRRFDTADELREAFGTAGFGEIRIVSDDYEAVAPDVGALWQHLWSTSHRRHLERMSPETLEAVRADYCARLQQHARTDGIHLVWRALLAVGDRAE
jgi:ubiquinone/menaquinone biosynthesis C-methylase UbiE